jgi:hypothetical protein
VDASTIDKDLDSGVVADTCGEARARRIRRAVVKAHAQRRNWA